MQVWYFHETIMDRDVPEIREQVEDLNMFCAVHSRNFFKYNRQCDQGFVKRTDLENVIDYRRRHRTSHTGQKHACSRYPGDLIFGKAIKELAGRLCHCIELLA